jgi:hypothetical protein
VNDLEAFAKLASALAPWNSQLVIVGGWAHRLYRHHQLAEVPAYKPLTTLDADVVFGSSGALEGDIKSALEDAGFKEDLFGNHRPPVSQYTLGDEGAGFYAEFLTPLRGSGTRRGGERDATTLAAGITAQKLRNLDILLVHPWQISVGIEQGVPFTNPIDLRIANPCSFIAQKFLIQSDRLREKRAQDLLYVHDTLELFGARLPELGALWREHVRPTLSEAELEHIEQSRRSNFHEVTDTLRASAAIPQDRSLIPERMRGFCEQALDEVLGQK